MAQNDLETSPHCILVVDDHCDVRECLCDILAYAGYLVITAEDGLDGLRVLHSTDSLPHLILTDLFMNDMDGFQFLKAVRAETRWHHIPFMFITGAVSNMKTSHGRPEYGGVACLSKPFALQDLLDAVDYALGQAVPTWSQETAQAAFLKVG